MPVPGSSHFGPYEILGPLKGGGQGKVYRARDPRLKRFVALKVLHDTNGHDPQRQARLLQEAQAASALNHQNIVVVYDVGIEGDEPFIVSELIDGSSLRDVMASGPMSVAELLAVAVQIAEGLTAAHEAGLVHRDIKPENVMVTPDRHAKILDFGIAKAVGAAGLAAETTDNARTRQTETIDGVIKGTIPYMSPEQARCGQVDFRSDQFSFGLVLYEMAAGRRAFAQDTLDQTRRAIIEDEPRPLGEVNPKTPVLLRWIVERCLAKAPEQRYAATVDLARDLRMLRDRLKDVLPAPPIVSTPAARRRWLPVAAAGSSALAVALLAWTLWPPAPAVPRFTPLASDSGYQGMPAWSPDGKTIAYVAEADGLRQVFTRSLAQPGRSQITHSTFDCRDPFWSRDGSRIYYISNIGEGYGVRSVSAAGGPSNVVQLNADFAALSSDGRTLAILRSDEPDTYLQLWLASPPQAEPKQYTREPFAKQSFANAFMRFAPDSSKLALMAKAWPSGNPDLSLWIVPTWDAPPFQVTSVPRGLSTNGAPRFDWLADGHRLVAALARESDPTAHLWVFDTVGGASMPLTTGTGEETTPAVSPSGQRIAYAAQDIDFDLVEVPVDGSPVRPILATSRNEMEPSWSQARSEYAFVTDRSGRPEIWLRSKDASWERRLVTETDFSDEPTYTFGLPAISPDGQKIAFERSTRSGTAIWAATTAGGPPVPITKSEPGWFVSTYSPTWSPDGEWIAYVNARPSHWSLAKVPAGAGAPAQILRDGILGITHPQWSPDNRWIACLTPQGLTLISSDGKNVKVVKEDEVWPVYAWSSDSSTLFGVAQRDDPQRLALLSVDVASGRERVLNDNMAPLPPVIAPIKGFSRISDKSFATSLVHVRSDLWLIDDFLPRQPLLDRLWPGNRR